MSAYELAQLNIGVIRGPMAGRTIIVATHRHAGGAGATQVITLSGRLAETASRPAGPRVVAAGS